MQIILIDQLCKMKTIFLSYAKPTNDLLKYSELRLLIWGWYGFLGAMPLAAGG